MLDGCAIHGETQASVIARWSNPAIESSKGAVTLCACCWGPALAVMAQVILEADGAVTDVLPGGVSRPVLCSRCQKITPEDAVAIVARLNAGYPVPA